MNTHGSVTRRYVPPAVQRRLYNQGHYTTPVPSVSTHRWTREDWIRWIDAYGVWHFQQEDNLP